MTETTGMSDIYETKRRSTSGPGQVLGLRTVHRDKRNTGSEFDLEANGSNRMFVASEGTDVPDGALMPLLIQRKVST